MAKQQLTLITTTPLIIDTDKIDGNKFTIFMSVVETLGLDNALTLYGDAIQKGDERYEVK